MNIHNPVRYENESMEQYRERRMASRRAVRVVLTGAPINPYHTGNGQHRRDVKAHGGIRQFKRAKYRANYPGYAERHPAP